MNSNFEQWMRDCAPEVEINEIKKEAHWAILKERMRLREIKHKQREERRLQTSMVAAVLMFIFIGGSMSPLGSDGFNITDSDNQFYDDGRLVQVGTTAGLNFVIPNDYSPEEAADLITQTKAQLGEMVGLTRLVASGGSTWSFGREIQMRGETTISWGVAVGFESVMAEKVLPFIFSDSGEKFLLDVDAGKYQPVRMEGVSVEGRPFSIKVYAKSFEKFGVVEYWIGVPAD